MKTSKPMLAKLWRFLSVLGLLAIVATPACHPQRAAEPCPQPHHRKGLSSSVTVPVDALNHQELLGDLGGQIKTGFQQAQTDLNNIFAVQAAYVTRGVITSNISSLSSFTVAGNDGLTYTAGQVLLAVAQTTASQNGPYVVGAVTSGSAPLSRPTWWATGNSINAGATFFASEGTSGAGTQWIVSTVAPITVDTTSVTFTYVDSPQLVQPSVYKARCVVTANTSLSSFVGVSGGSTTNTDGCTAAQGDIVLATAQTTATQNGPYVVGVVATGAAPLSRPVWWQTASTQPVGSVISVSGEGTVYKNTTWKAMSANSTIVVDTTDPKFYPACVTFTATLQSGVITAGASATSGAPATAYIFSANTQLLATRKTASGTTSTIGYAYDGAPTPGVGAAGAISLMAAVAAGTINSADGSTMVVTYCNQI